MLTVTNTAKSLAEINCFSALIFKIYHFIRHLYYKNCVLYHKSLKLNFIAT